LGTSRRRNKGAKRGTKILIDASATQTKTRKKKDSRFGNKVKIKRTLPFELDLFEHASIRRLMSKPVRITISMQSGLDVTLTRASGQLQTPCRLSSKHIKKQRKVSA
jgi:hypothetical protein